MAQTAEQRWRVCSRRGLGEYRRNNNNTRAHMQGRAAKLFSFCCCCPRYYRSVTDHFRSISYTHYYHCAFFFLLLFFSILGLVSSNLSIPYREITDEMNIFWGSFVVSISTLSVRVTLNRMCIISHQFFNAKTFEIELQIAFCQFSEWKGKPWFLLFVQRS